METKHKRSITATGKDHFDPIETALIASLYQQKDFRSYLKKTERGGFFRTSAETRLLTTIMDEGE